MVKECVGEKKRIRTVNDLMRAEIDVENGNGHGESQGCWVQDLLYNQCGRETLAKCCDQLGRGVGTGPPSSWLVDAKTLLSERTRPGSRKSDDLPSYGWE
jgi:hypothetical protein